MWQAQTKPACAEHDNTKQNQATTPKFEQSVPFSCMGMAIETEVELSSLYMNPV